MRQVLCLIRLDEDFNPFVPLVLKGSTQLRGLLKPKQFLPFMCIFSFIVFQQWRKHSKMNGYTRVSGTMAARSSSVRVIACLNLCQVLPLLMHVGNWLAALLATKRSAGIAPKVGLRKCTLHSPPQKVNMAEPTLALKPRGDVTRKPKQGQWHPKRTCVRQKL